MHAANNNKFLVNKVQVKQYLAIAYSRGAIHIYALY